jgi:hypothetical protein
MDFGEVLRIILLPYTSRQREIRTISHPSTRGTENKLDDHLVQFPALERFGIQSAAQGWTEDSKELYSPNLHGEAKKQWSMHLLRKDCSIL